MLTSDQEKWISHLSNDDHVVIKPYDPSASLKFEVVKDRIRAVLGKDIKVEHRGATSLGISGQDEIDVYIPVEPSGFNALIESLSKLFSSPRSHYPLERARFITVVDGKHIDVFVINAQSKGWINGVIFEDHLRSNPDALEAYRKLKENGNGLSTQEYYRRKIEFINGVLDGIERGINL